MCPLVVNYLQPLKKALNGSNSIKFVGRINENDQSGFSNHLQLLNHVQEELLPICDSTYKYHFQIQFQTQSDESASANVIRRILQMHPVDRCSNVEISLCQLKEQSNKLPIKAVSKFFDRKCIKFDGDSIYLRITYIWQKIRNVRAICDHFKKVIKYFLFPSKNFWVHIIRRR